MRIDGFETAPAAVDLQLIAEQVTAKAGFASGKPMLVLRQPVDMPSALQLAHGLQALYAVEPFCSERTTVDMSLLPIAAPDDMPKRPWFYEDVAARCVREVREFYGDLDIFKHAFKSYTSVAPEWLKGASKWISRYFRDESYRNACSYLFKSMHDLGYDACDWKEEQYNPDFDRYIPVSTAESAFLNAFKAVEALLGEPSKDRTEEKVRSRLAALGLNPDTLGGYATRMTLVDRIVAGVPIRDQIAAHGKSKAKRRLRLPEIIEMQALARHLLLASSL